MRTAPLKATMPWLAAACFAFAIPAHAQTTPAAPPPAAPAPAGPTSLLTLGPVNFDAQIEGGVVFNPSNPSNGENFGQLFTDHANQAQLNQVLLTATKPIDLTSNTYQWGFRLQGMYGSDARYTHFLGELDRATSDRYQFDITEADVLLHLPVLGANGMDVKIGQYPTPIGYETIDPSTNPFYTHSYIFNFGLPLKHTGVLAVTHASSLLDIYTGVDTGSNTTFGSQGDNNGAGAVLFGFGLNMMGGNLTLLALTHIGPEYATRVLQPIGVNANGQYRYFNDIVLTYKASPKLTLVTEANLIRDDYGVVGKPVNAFGIAQYASYALNDTITLNGRAEIYRDDNNFFVGSFPGNRDFLLAEQGYSTPNVSFAPGNSTTYSEITVGFTYKPPMPAPVNGLLLRPEVRWDHSMTNNKPFNGQKDNSAITIAADAVLTF